MKILYLHRTQARGVEAVHIRGIVDVMRQAGHEVRIVGPAGSDPYADGDSKRRRSPWARFARHAPEFVFELAELVYDHSLSARLEQEASEFAPDLIYERYAFFVRSGSEFAQKRGIPLLMEVNYTCADELVRERSKLFTGIAKKRERRVFGQAGLLCVVSSKLEERVRAQGVPPEKIVITPNAVEPAWLDEAARLAAKPLPPAFSEHPVIGYVGGFYSWHKVDSLVAAARACRDLGRPSALLLVGDGPDRSRIDEEIRAAHLEDLVVMPGQVHHSELNGWIKAMDICTLPSSNDYCSPMKVFEYMALGKVVLAPDLQNLRDVIAHGENGYLFGVVDGGEAAAMSRSLEILLGDAELRKSIGEAARKTVRERHTWPQNLRRIFLAAGLGDPFPELTALPSIAE